MRVYYYPLPHGLLESWGWAVENLQNLEGKELISKMFRNKDLDRFVGKFYGYS